MAAMKHLCLNEKLAEFDFNILQILLKSTLCVILCELFNFFGYSVFCLKVIIQLCKFFCISPSIAYANLSIPLFSLLNKIEVHQLVQS